MGGKRLSGLKDLIGEEARISGRQERLRDTTELGMPEERVEGGETEAVVHGRTRGESAAERYVESSPVASVPDPPTLRESAHPDTGLGPKYLKLHAKLTRLREDQMVDLTALARRANREKVTQGERITENTLIRVAVDWILSHATDVRGSSEEEIRHHLNVPRRS
jgi:hypothetical protein